MITIDIPGFKVIHAEHLVLDYNGTLAIDGTIIHGIKDILNSLAEDIQIHVITANTFGKVNKNLEEVNCQLVILNEENQQVQKAKYIAKLGEEMVITVGNGMNDALMLKNAALGIAVIQKEGASVQALINADIVCNNITDAIDLLINPLRVVATLRN
jgi:soluble P-type ATPase